MKKVAELVIKNRIIIIFIWLILFIFSGINLIYNKNTFETGVGEINGSISKQVAEDLRSEFKTPFSNNLIITFSSDKYKINQREYKDFLIKLEQVLDSESNIKQVFSPVNGKIENLVNKKGNKSIILLQLTNSNFSFAESYVPELRSVLNNFAKEYSNIDNSLKIYLTGNAAYSYDMNEISEKEGQKAEQRVMILTFIVLIFAFRSITASLFAVVAGAMSSIISISLLKLVTGYFTLSIFCQNISSMVGLALGIDYSLLLITRFRKEIQNNSPEYALKETLNTAGVSIFYSGITVFIGFMALFLPDLRVTQSIGIGGATVVFFSIIIAITLTPSLLYVFNKYLEFPTFLSKKMLGSNKFNFNKKWSEFIIKRSFLATFVTILILLCISYPLLDIKLADPEIRSMPDIMESKKGFLELQDISDSDTMFPIYFILDFENDVFDNQNLIKIYSFIQKLKQDSRIGDAISIVSLKKDLQIMDYIFFYNTSVNTEEYNYVRDFFISKNGKSTVIQIFPVKNLNSYQINTLVKDLRKLESEEFKIKVGGPASVSHDLVTMLYKAFPVIIFSVYFVTIILLMIAFKSILIPIKAVFTNTFAILASYGVLVMVFQYGWFSGLFNIVHSPESIVSAIPVVLFCIMFSLSMDYEVFLLSRMHEAYLETNDNDQAIVIGLTETSGVITKAALVMLIVFGAFTQANIILIQMTGLGLAASVLIDATLLRMVFVPAFMKLAGKANWYFPKFLK